MPRSHHKKNATSIGILIVDRFQRMSTVWFRALLLCVLVSTLWLLPVTVFAQTPAPHTNSTNVDLTPEEQAWLKAHPRIVLGAPTDYPPMVIRRTDGTHTGVLVDLFEQISRKLNTRIGLHIGNSWSGVQEKAQQGEIDGLAFGGRDPSRDALYNATDIVMPTYFFVFGRSRIENQIKSFSDLDGKRIGYKGAARPTRSLLEKLPSTVLKPYDSHESMTQALLGKEIDVIVAWMSYDHWRKKTLQGTIDKIYLIEEYPLEMVIYVRKDWPEFLPIINKAIAVLQQGELPRIINKWFGEWPKSSTFTGVHLTPEEQAWIDDNPSLGRIALQIHEKVKLSDRERQWLESKQDVPVRVGDYPPFFFVDDDSPQGLSIDYVRMICSAFDMNCRFVTGIPVSESFSMMQEPGGIAVQPAWQRNAEREEIATFTTPYLVSPFVIFKRKGTADPIRSMEDLTGKRIVVEKGYAIHRLLEQNYPEQELVEVNFSSEALETLSAGEADAYISSMLSGLYMAVQQGVPNIEVAAQAPFEPNKMAIAVRKDHPELASIFNKAITAITPSEHITIKQRWTTDLEGTFSSPQVPRINYTAQENAWLGQNHRVRVRITDYPPYLVIDSNKLPQGVAIEYLKLIEERTGVTFKYEATDLPFVEFLENIKLRRGFDMAAVIVPTAEREQYLSFSEPYLSSPYVIFVREEGETILDISALFGRTIAVPRGHVVQEQLERNYPKIRLALFDSDEEALQALSTAQADAYIGNLTMASHILQMRGLSNIKVAAATPFGDQSFSIGNRSDWPELTSIINKALASITEEEKTAIRNKYLAIKYEHGIDKAEVLKWVSIVGAAVAVFFFIFVYWTRRLSLEIGIRKQTERELKQARDDAEAANQAKSAFLANMSHELRTPLHAILGFSRLLARDSGVKETHLEQLDIINRSGEHLLGMVDDILSLSKIEAGRMDLKQEVFDFVKLLHDVSEMVKTRSEDKGLRFILELDPGLPPYVVGDAGKLRQVLINLLGNAVKFTEKGEVWLRACSHPMAPPGKVLLQMEVQDTGPGIPKDRLDDVFENFVRLEHAQIIERGTGLGLAISKSLVSLMDGKIMLESELGQGSLFKVKLPMKLTKAGEAAAPSEPPMAEVIGLQADQPNWRILVVDDNLENRVLLTTLLTRIGCSMKEAINGEQTIKIFQEWHPHFIWMDMRMPVMDGFEATRKIRTLPGGESVRIVAVTASVLEKQHNKMLACGCDEVVHKPFKDNEIFESMARLLEIKYLFKDKSTEALQKPGINLTAEMLAELPPDLLQELGETTLMLNMDAILKVIERITEHAPDAAESLRQLVQNFEIKHIRELLAELG